MSGQRLHVRVCGLPLSFTLRTVALQSCAYPGALATLVASELGAFASTTLHDASQVPFNVAALQPGAAARAVVDTCGMGAFEACALSALADAHSLLRVVVTPLDSQEAICGAEHKCYVPDTTQSKQATEPGTEVQQRLDTAWKVYDPAKSRSSSQSSTLTLVSDRNGGRVPLVYQLQLRTKLGKGAPMPSSNMHAARLTQPLPHTPPVKS